VPAQWSGRVWSGDGSTDTYSNHEHIALLCTWRDTSQPNDNGRLGERWAIKE